ncbi:alpha/beta fold hydrolase [Actinospica durhamensis]|uniref:Alpha/beta fold hydrolase n=1 Tax=Actinospica durhamensis TaxID=1508375 RepID=A0A941EWV8_9ACTN|nr:alpha/beta fold hydrolase [Actinospica durhamensis]MBR7836469.1 alpha/beta fold hydrolase [Actinospica durhamensis]
MSNAILTWEPPQPGPAVRGTVILLPGRGEHPGVYERFGRRLAFDAYTVHAIAAPPQQDPADLRDQIAALVAASAGPVVLAGSDTGALHALALATEGKLDVDGLLLVGLPGAGFDDAATESPEWERELELRTGCPTHRGRLTEDPEFTRGSLFDPVPERLSAFLDLDDAAYAAVQAHTLVLHGASDLLAAPVLAAALAGRLPRAALALVREAPHDVLNDAAHRSVAAAVVQWLEALRSGAPDTPFVASA